MDAIKNVAIVGLGAIGAIYAVKLAQHDPGCLRVIVDETRRERYRRDGVCLNEQRYDFTYVTPDEAGEKADLILVATKSEGLTDAIAAMQPFVHDRTLILSLMNGISSPAAIAAAYGWDKVLHAFFVGHGSTRVGNAITFDGVGRIVFGDADVDGQSSRVERVAQFFTQAGIAYEVPPDILFALWSKFVLNVGVNQASAVLRATYGEFQRNPRALEIAVDLMQEAVALAHIVGIRNADGLLPWSLDFIRNMPSGFKSSMLQDIEAGRRTEIDLFAGVICALGAQHQVDTPYNQLFYRLIRALENA
ncbi:MAG: ketopantoate reductase family protein [Chloroflexota bacterium]|nr:ketopantoate reductase family protein [Chloroflexota bacterium]